MDNMKSKFIIILCVLCFTNVGCQKDITQEIDITQFVWEINSVKIEHTMHRIENQCFFNSESYKLIFKQDGGSGRMAFCVFPINGCSTRA